QSATAQEIRVSNYHVRDGNSGRTFCIVGRKARRGGGSGDRSRNRSGVLDNFQFLGVDGQREHASARSRGVGSRSFLWAAGWIPDLESPDVTVHPEANLVAGKPPSRRE